jgi:hypothetical protein
MCQPAQRRNFPAFRHVVPCPLNEHSRLPGHARVARLGIIPRSKVKLENPRWWAVETRLPSERASRCRIRLRARRRTAAHESARRRTAAGAVAGGSWRARAAERLEDGTCAGRRRTADATPCESATARAAEKRADHIVAVTNARSGSNGWVCITIRSAKGAKSPVGNDPESRLIELKPNLAVGG